MSCTTYNRARKVLMAGGVGAAPFVIALHTCPVPHDPLAPPPEHVEQEAYQPLEMHAIEFVTSGSSSGSGIAKLTLSAQGTGHAGSVGVSRLV